MKPQAAKATSSATSACKPTIRQGETEGCRSRSACACAALSRLYASSSDSSESNPETGVIIDISNYAQVTRGNCRKASHYTENAVTY